MAIITYPLNGITYNAEDVETYLGGRTSGVFSADDSFIATADGASRNITIGHGLAWIKNDLYAGKSVAVTENEIVTIPIANGTLPRIDRIVLRFDKTNNKSTLAVKQGTASSSPIAPDLEQTVLIYELGLYTVNVAAGSLTVSQSDIENTMLDESVCGVVRDGVEKIPTKQLFTQFEAQFKDWFLNLQNDLDENQATNLFNLAMKATANKILISLASDGWVVYNEERKVYTQVVTSQIAAKYAVTDKTKVDLQPDVDAFEVITEAGISLIYAQNDGGEITIYAKADSVPSEVIEVQATAVEVE